MKSAIPWILAAALLAGIYFVYSGDRDKTAQLEKQLAQQAEDLDKARAENDALKNNPAQNEELTRLRKDSTELLRLRAESQQLRGAIKELSAKLATAQAQGTQAEQAQQQKLAQLAGENEALKTQTQKAQQAQGHAAACINNLRVIDTAKNQWAAANNKPADATPTGADLAPYLPPNAQIACPDGGTYSINALNAAPTCSVPGHVLK